MDATNFAVMLDNFLDWTGGFAPDECDDAQILQFAEDYSLEPGYTNIELFNLLKTNNGTSISLEDLVKLLYKE